MKGSILIGRIKGIDIELHFSWAVIFALITFMMASSFFPQNYPELEPVMAVFLGSVIALLMLASILLHELSHSLVSKSLGIDVKKITLFIFGGIAQMQKEPDDPIKELKISLAGPLMSILLYIVLLIISMMMRYLGVNEAYIVPLSYVSNLNLILALFNMVPAFPMDGGRVLRALIWHFSGSLKNATQIASSMGGMFGYFLMFLGFYWIFTGNVINGVWFLFIGWFIRQLSESSYQNMLMTDLFKDIKVREFMSDKVITVPAAASIRELIDEYFYKYKFASFPVKNGEEIIGIVTVDSIKSMQRNLWESTTVESITVQIRDNLVATPENNVTDAMNKLFSNDIGRVLVIDEGVLVGIVSRTDILNFIRIHSQLGE
jgi:Zn-dependent protease